MRTDLKYLIIFLIGIVLTALLFKQCTKDDKEKVNLYENQDTIKFYKDKQGLDHAKIKTLEAENMNNFINLKSKDSEIIALQALVKDFKSKLKGGGSATIIGTKTEVNLTTSTTILPNPVDSITGKSLVCNPTYSTSYKDKWIQYDITMNKDSSNFGFQSTNNYSVVIGSERDNKWKFWQKKKSFVDVTNENPYDKIKTLRSFNVVEKKERISVGVQGGYGLTLSGFSPYIGLGVQFKLFGL